MKNIITVFALISALFCFAQVPQGISYQAIALDGTGNPIVSLPIGIRISIVDSSASGTVLYTETHTPTTNAQGLYDLVIGQGTPTLGAFSAIKWETNSKFLQLEMDAAGGTNYVLVGSTQLLSVPYALYAGKVDSENVIGGPDISPISGYTYSSSFMTSTNAYVYSPSFYSQNSSSTFTWHNTAISGIPFMKSNNSFLTSTNTYIFGPSDTSNGNLYTWHSYPISGQPHKVMTNFGATLVTTSTNAYAYRVSTSNTYDWVPTNISGTIIDIAIDQQYFGILTTTNAYVYGPNATGTANTWISIPITGNPLRIKASINAGIMILTSANAYFYGPNQYNNPNNSTYSWHNIPYSGNLLLD